MKSKKVFDFLQKAKLEIKLEQYLGELLRIDSKATMEYLMRKYGRY